MTKEIQWNSIDYPEIDYQGVVALLKNYRHPRRKINDLLKSGKLIRVKKGLYVLGSELRSSSPSSYKLANLIYGPSYVSCHSALSYHGFIPERTSLIQSSTPVRNKDFETPLGAFAYRRISPEQYECLYEIIENKDGSTLLMALPEKALVEIMWQQRRRLDLEKTELEAYLFDDLRLDRQAFAKLKPARVAKLVKLFSTKSTRSLLAFLKEARDE